MRCHVCRRVNYRLRCGQGRNSQERFCKKSLFLIQSHMCFYLLKSSNFTHLNRFKGLYLILKYMLNSLSYFGDRYIMKLLWTEWRRPNFFIPVPTQCTNTHLYEFLWQHDITFRGGGSTIPTPSFSSLFPSAFLPGLNSVNKGSGAFCFYRAMLTRISALISVLPLYVSGKACTKCVWTK